MLGAVLGDCLGSPFEFLDNLKAVSGTKVEKQFAKYANHSKEKKGPWPYTDDTAMARQVATVLGETKLNDRINMRNLAERSGQLLSIFLGILV